MTIDAQAALDAVRLAVTGVASAIAEKDANLTALSLQVDSLSAANVGLQAQLDTANQTIAELRKQIEPPAPKTVLDYGAKGDGIADDTAAIQKAIDAGDGRVPAGRYLIDPLKTITIGPMQGMTLDPAAVLILKPNAAPRYCGVRVEGGSLVGGQIIGDRLQHTFTAGSTHEWGYGVQVRGKGSVVMAVTISQCTGDGLGVSGADHLIEDVVSTQNRRQGCSIFACSKVEFHGCKFTKTGALNGQPGTNPRCGVDIEPDAGWAEDVLFDNCEITDNEVTGLVAWIRAEVVGGVRGLVVQNCRIQGVNAVHMKALAGSISASIKDCQIKRGSGTGMRIEAGATVGVEGCTFATPTDRTDFTLTGMDARTKYDIYVLTGGKANAGTNRYI